MAKRSKKGADGGRPLRMTAEEKAAITEKANAGMSALAISKEVGRAYLTVLRFLKGAKTKGRKAGGKRRGRPPGRRAGAVSSGRLNSAQAAFDRALRELLEAQGEAATAGLIDRLRSL